MKPADIKKGDTVTVGWFSPGGHLSYRRDYLATGTVLLRRKGEIRFAHESGDDMISDFHGWPANNCENYRVNLADIKSVNGIPILEWGTMTPAQVKARAALALARK